MRVATVLAAGLTLAGISAKRTEETAHLPYIVDFDDAEIRDTCLTVEDVNVMNRKVSADIDETAQSRYFSVWKVDLSNRLCPFKDDSGMCGNRACAIEPMDNDLPEKWQAQYLGRLRQDSVSKEAPDDAVDDCAPEERSVYAYLGRTHGRHDYCYPEDESANSDGVWVDLNDNVERYTGYSGADAHKVWRAVYQENCFGYAGEQYAPKDENKAVSPAVSGLDASGRTLAGMFAESQEDKHIRQEVGGDAACEVMNQETQCMEQRLFYTLLSGMHASISTHLSYDSLNTTTGVWGPNLEQFMSRVGDFPERLNSLYFNYVLVSRAVAKLQNYIGLMSFSSTCNDVDREVRQELWRLTTTLNSGKPGIDESRLFHSPQAKPLKEEFRQRVRNVNALMSCVGCERCRLWSKLQTAGYGTALKLLFELPEKPEDDPVAVREVLSEFRRSELVALVQTFARLSHSINAVNYFGRAVENQYINKKAFSYQLRQGLREVGEALRFIGRSYIDMPKNFFRFFVFYANIYWNKFIGRQYTVVTSHVEL